MVSGVAVVPAVPGLAPRGFYWESGARGIEAPSASWGSVTWRATSTQPGSSGMVRGVAVVPAVPGLAARGLYGGERAGLAVGLW